MRDKFGTVILDIASAVLLGLGIALLVSPVVLHLCLGADNDAYIQIAEWAGGKPNILAQFNLAWMFRVDFLPWPLILIITGLALRCLLWHWLRAGLSLGANEQAG